MDVFVKERSVVSCMIELFYNEIKNWFSTCIHVLCANNIMEYMKVDIFLFCANN